MTELRAYALLIAYPAIIIFVFDWIGFFPRSNEDRARILSAQFKAREENLGRSWLLVKYGLLFVVLRMIAGKALWQIFPHMANARSWTSMALAGTTFGVLLVVLRRGISLLSPRAAAAEKLEYFLHGSTGSWLSIFVLGGFVEESWRALCIIAFRQNGYSDLTAILITAAAFGIAHVSGLPSRVYADDVTVEMLIGLILGVLFTWFANIVAPCLASIIYFTFSYFRARASLAETI
jgi:membrane protease YdiL (CAAX protease family)